jgi:hypothetical protein
MQEGVGNQQAHSRCCRGAHELACSPPQRAQRAREHRKGETTLVRAGTGVQCVVCAELAQLIDRTGLDFFW